MICINPEYEDSKKDIYISGITHHASNQYSIRVFSDTDTDTDTNTDTTQHTFCALLFYSESCKRSSGHGAGHDWET